MVTIQDRREGNVLVMTVSGTITFDAMRPLNSRLHAIYAKGRSKFLVINLEEVDQVDASGVGLLVASRNIVNRNMGQLYLCGLRPSVKTVLEEMNLLNYFSICGTEREALQGAERFEQFMGADPGARGKEGRRHERRSCERA